MVREQRSTHAPGSVLRGKVALIMGAGQPAGLAVGNGWTAATAFARQGARVCCVDKDLAKCEKTAAYCRSLGVEAAALEADVSSDTAVRSLVGACRERFGSIDILHNNLSIEDGDLLKLTEMSLEVFDRIIQSNLADIMLVCKHVLRVMREQHSGNIINVSTIGSVLSLRSGRRSGKAYKLCKAAVNSLTTNLAMENAKYGIRVNAILPGFMDAPLPIKCQAKMLSEEEGLIEQDAKEIVWRARSVQDTARAACFLASENATFITGVLLPVNEAC